MYEDARTSVKCSMGNTGKFESKIAKILSKRKGIQDNAVGVHQRFCLSPLLFIIVSEHVRREVPWYNLYDRIVVDEK